MSDHSSDTTVIRQNSRALWWAIILVVAATGIGIAASGLSVDWKSNPTLLIVVATYVATMFFYQRIRVDERISQALTTVAQLLLILISGLLCSYAAAVTALPYRDAEFLAIDQWLGFDRTSYVHFFTDKPWKVSLSNFVYLSMLPQLSIVPFAMIMTNRIQRIQRFIAAYGFALISTVVIFIFVPAVGAFVYFDLTPAQYAALPIDVYTPARSLDALRSGAMKLIRLNDLEGLIAFPSFHTAAAILYTWVLWPLKLVRWPIAALNIAIISTTPIGGSHYAIDIVAGAIVAAGSIVASGLLCRTKVELTADPLRSQDDTKTDTLGGWKGREC